MTTTPEPAVSPAPDTDALRQQVARALNEAIGGQLDGGQSLATATDAVLALPWIKYAAGQRHVVTMHERNNAAIAETNREFAEENAGLRADLDRARAERDARQRVLDEIREHLDLPDTADLAMVESMARVAIKTADELTELARSAGARTIPDDAAFTLSAAIWLGLNQAGMPLTDEQRPAVTQVVFDKIRSWATPTTDPDVEWEHRHDPAEDIGCSNPPAVSCSDAGCPRHGHDTEEGDDDE